MSALGRDCRGWGRRTAMAVAALVVVASAVVAAEDSILPWTLRAWRYRQVVTLVTPDPSGTINTALIRVEAPRTLMAEDARDLRVMDAKGAPVRFHVVDGEGNELPGAPAPDAPLRLHVEISDPMMTRYAVYFGNPEAVAERAAWEKRVGGLTLETRANAQRQPVPDINHFRNLLKQSTTVYGSGPRRQINDPANPFGPSEYYIGIYRGMIHCPVNGAYAFATDSDDASFLLINGTLVVQWPGAHNPAGTFDQHKGIKHLEAGIHQIEYYHVQSGGGALARAGWLPPGATEFEIIPEEAFVRELRTETECVEDRDYPLSVYFTAEVREAFRWGKDGPFVIRATLRDRSRSRAGEVALRAWDVSGRLIEGGPELEGVFVGVERHTASLRVVDAFGCEGTWTRTIACDPERVERIDVALETTTHERLLEPSEPLTLTAAYQNGGRRSQPLDLVAEVGVEPGRPVQRWSSAIAPAPGSWVRKEFLIADAGGVPLTTGWAEIRLEYAGQAIVQRRTALREASDARLRCVLQGERLMDEQGVPLVLRLTDRPYARSKPAFAERLRTGGPVTIFYVDDGLSGSGPDTYLDRFDAAIKSHRPGSEVRRVRIGSPPQRSDLFETMDALARAAEATPPDLVVIAASIRSITRFEPVDRFERELRCLVDRVEAVCGCDAVLIAPPPVIANPGFGQGYAIAAKRVGLLKRIAVADAYTGFLEKGKAPFAGRPSEQTVQDEWRRFYRDPSATAPVYHLAPNAEGQKLLAELVWSAVLSRRGAMP